MRFRWFLLHFCILRRGWLGPRFFIISSQIKTVSSLWDHLTNKNQSPEKAAWPCLIFQSKKNRDFLFYFSSQLSWEEGKLLSTYAYDFRKHHFLTRHVSEKLVGKHSGDKSQWPFIDNQTHYHLILSPSLREIAFPQSVLPHFLPPSGIFSICLVL